MATRRSFMTRHLKPSSKQMELGVEGVHPEMAKLVNTIRRDDTAMELIESGSTANLTNHIVSAYSNDLSPGAARSGTGLPGLSEKPRVTALANWLIGHHKHMKALAALSKKFEFGKK